MSANLATKTTTQRPRRMAREPQPGGNPASTPTAQNADVEHRPTSKAAQVLTLLQRPEGATIDQLVTATGWLPHTTRAALTGLKKKGHVLVSEKLDGAARVYRIAPAPNAEPTLADA